MLQRRGGHVVEEEEAEVVVVAVEGDGAEVVAGDSKRTVEKQNGCAVESFRSIHCFCICLGESLAADKCWYIPKRYSHA